MAASPRSGRPRNWNAKRASSGRSTLALRPCAKVEGSPQVRLVGFVAQHGDSGDESGCARRRWLDVARRGSTVEGELAPVGHGSSAFLFVPEFPWGVRIALTPGGRIAMSTFATHALGRHASLRTCGACSPCGGRGGPFRLSQALSAAARAGNGRAVPPRDARARAWGSGSGRDVRPGGQELHRP